MSENYIKNHFNDIKKFANVIEDRPDDDFTLENALEENAKTLALAIKHKVDYILIDDEYKFDILPD